MMRKDFWDDVPDFIFLQRFDYFNRLIFA